MPPLHLARRFPIPALSQHQRQARSQLQPQIRPKFHTPLPPAELQTQNRKSSGFTQETLQNNLAAIPEFQLQRPVVQDKMPVNYVLCYTKGFETLNPKLGSKTLNPSDMAGTAVIIYLSFLLQMA